MVLTTGKVALGRFYDRHAIAAAFLPSCLVGDCGFELGQEAQWWITPSQWILHH